MDHRLCVYKSRWRLNFLQNRHCVFDVEKIKESEGLILESRIRTLPYKSPYKVLRESVTYPLVLTKVFEIGKGRNHYLNSRNTSQNHFEVPSSRVGPTGTLSGPSKVFTLSSRCAGPTHQPSPWIRDPTNFIGVH